MIRNIHNKIKNINQLKNEIIDLKTQLRNIKDGLNEMFSYVSSEKFIEDQYVNVSDIILRINEIKKDILI